MSQNKENKLPEPKIYTPPTYIIYSSKFYYGYWGLLIFMALSFTLLLISYTWILTQVYSNLKADWKTLEVLQITLLSFLFLIFLSSTIFSFYYIIKSIRRGYLRWLGYNNIWWHYYPSSKKPKSEEDKKTL